MASKYEEMIVAAPREAVFGEGEKLASQGVITGETANQIIKNFGNNAFIGRRGHDKEDPSVSLEANPAFKQSIPYGIVTSDDRDGELRVFGYRRLEGGGEGRLHGKLSIGVGGHMNELFTPETFEKVIKEEAYRELTEELVFDSVEGTPDVTKYPVEFIGLINDDEEEVGRVHLGIAYTLETNPNHSVEVRETEQLEGNWYTLAELEALKDNMESWSVFALEALKQNA